jgi:hypothetical protein
MLEKKRVKRSAGTRMTAVFRYLRAMSPCSQALR